MITRYFVLAFPVAILLLVGCSRLTESKFKRECYAICNEVIKRDCAGEKDKELNFCINNLLPVVGQCKNECDAEDALRKKATSN